MIKLVNQHRLGIGGNTFFFITFMLIFFLTLG